MASVGDSLPYTCNACLVAFRNSDSQREHMRRDWHLYNVKRRVASLPPVSQEVFTEKVLTARASSSAAAAKASFEKTCDACQKTFYSENSFQNHIKSSKHKLRENAMKKKGLPDDSSSVISSSFSLGVGEPVNKSVSGDTEPTVSHVTNKLKNTAIEEEDNEDENMEEEGDGDKKYSVSRCLFCSEHTADLESNVDHMYKVHGMFIPERDYLSDLEGLVRYLHAKVNENHECLHCHAIRTTAAGVRTHMRDKGHCMIAFETEEEQIEIGQFYDFRSTYSDDEDEDEDMEGGVPVTSSDADEGGWETDDSSATSVESDKEQKPYRGSQPVYETDYELHLPSGRSVGHRSLAKYYRQNLHSYPTADERAERQLAIENGDAAEEDAPTTTIKRNNHTAIVSRANGGLGMVGATPQQKSQAATSEKRERTRAQRSERKYTAKVNRQANNQKHYRDPLLQ